MDESVDNANVENEGAKNGVVRADEGGLRSFAEQAVIKVCGIGGGGGNAVDRMIHEGLQDAEFIVINTDAQALKRSPAAIRLQIGAEITGGLGSGADPEIGRQSALEDRERIAEVLEGADMVFLTAGLGGGTGTGAAPIVAEVARESKALTVAIVTLPFDFEGPKRQKNAYAGLAALEEHVDTLIVVPNDRVIEYSPEDMKIADAFRQADEVLHNGVQSITELIQLPGRINADFADVRTVMRARGRALIGIGIGRREEPRDGDGGQPSQRKGSDRAIVAARAAIDCPLLEQSDITGATEVLVNIIGGQDMGIHEVNKAVSTVRNAAHPEANVIWGAVFDDDEQPELRVTVIAAGFEDIEEPAEPEEASATQAAFSTGPEAEKEVSKEYVFTLEEVQLSGEPPKAEETTEVFVGAGVGDSSTEQQELDIREPAFRRHRKSPVQGRKEAAAPPANRPRKTETAAHEPHHAPSENAGEQVGSLRARREEPAERRVRDSAQNGAQAEPPRRQQHKANEEPGQTELEQQSAEPKRVTKRMAGFMANRASRRKPRDAE